MRQIAVRAGSYQAYIDGISGIMAVSMARICEAQGTDKETWSNAPELFEMIQTHPDFGRMVNMAKQMTADIVGYDYVIDK